MKLTYCDLCKEIISPGAKKYLFPYIKTIETLERRKDSLVRTEQEMMLLLQRLYSESEFLDICYGCKKVYQAFLEIRKEELTKQKKELEKIVKEQFSKPEENESDSKGSKEEKK